MSLVPALRVEIYETGRQVRYHVFTSSGHFDGYQSPPPDVLFIVLINGRRCDSFLSKDQAIRTVLEAFGQVDIIFTQ